MNLHDSVTPFAESIASALLLVCGIWVLFMAPLSALVVGAVARVRHFQRSVVGVLTVSAAAALLWLVLGYGLVFGAPTAGGLIGDPLAGVAVLGSSVHGGPARLYALAYLGFQGTVAVAAVAILCASLAHRVTLPRMLVFGLVWMIVVFAPLSFGLANAERGWGTVWLTASDFAGGAFLHVTIAASMLAATLVLCRVRASGRARRGSVVAPGDFRAAALQHPLALAAAAIMWVGWLMLSAGEEGAFDGVTLPVFVNVFASSCAGMLAWLIVDVIKRHRSTPLDAALGLFAGVAAAAAGANLLTPAWSLIGGALGGALASTAAQLGTRWHAGPIFDLIAAHLVGGLVGLLFVGIVGTNVGVFDTAGIGLLAANATVALIALVWSFGASALIAVAVFRLGRRGRPPTADRA